MLRLRPAGLTRPMVAAGLLALLGLAALDPERFVAEHNVARWTETGRIDTYYLSTLSADAAPALLALPEPLRSCTLAPIVDRLAVPDDWRSANLTRANLTRANLTRANLTRANLTRANLTRAIARGQLAAHCPDDRFAG